jgi:hypothetical protein
MSTERAFDPEQPLKAQPTIRGYNHWVVSQLMEGKGISPAEAVAWIVDRWVDDNRAFLEEEFGLSRDRYKCELAEAKVVKPFPDSRIGKSG